LRLKIDASSNHPPARQSNLRINHL
jgi:hypothetical protein